MQQRILFNGNSDTLQSMDGSDVLAMLSMIDWLITQIGPIDETSAACLAMARQSLAAFAPHPPKPQ